MTDIEEAARRMLLRARSQAEQLLAAAQREAETMREGAKAEGKQEGFEEGRVEGIKFGQDAGRTQALQQHSQQLSDTFKALSSAAVEFDQHREELASEGLREVVQLAVSIARRVTKRQGLIDESVLAGNLVEAMRLVVHKADVRIVVHPDQRACMDEALPKLKSQWPAMRHVELLSDATVSPGGCRVLTGQGCIDADLDAQLDRVVADLLPTPDTTAPAGGEARL